MRFKKFRTTFLFFSLRIYSYTKTSINLSLSQSAFFCLLLDCLSFTIFLSSFLNISFSLSFSLPFSVCLFNVCFQSFSQWVSRSLQLPSVSHSVCLFPCLLDSSFLATHTATSRYIMLICERTVRLEALHSATTRWGWINIHRRYNRDRKTDRRIIFGTNTMDF